jgi:hypothetical protein
MPPPYPVVAVAVVIDVDSDVNPEPVTESPYSTDKHPPLSFACALVTVLLLNANADDVAVDEYVTAAQPPDPLVVCEFINIEPDMVTDAYAAAPDRTDILPPSEFELHPVHSKLVIEIGHVLPVVHIRLL